MRVETEKRDLTEIASSSAPGGLLAMAGRDPLCRGDRVALLSLALRGYVYFLPAFRLAT